MSCIRSTYETITYSLWILQILSLCHAAAAKYVCARWIHACFCTVHADFSMSPSWICIRFLWMVLFVNVWVNYLLLQDNINKTERFLYSMISSLNCVRITNFIHKMFRWLRFFFSENFVSFGYTLLCPSPQPMMILTRWTNQVVHQ